MTVAAIIDKFTGEIVTARKDMLVTEAIRLLAGRKIGAMPVVDDADAVVGIMSERDIIYCLQADGAAILDWPVEKIMTAPAITVERSMTVMSALSLMTKRRIRHLPVVENGRLVGIVSIGDLVKYRMDKIEEEAAQMLNYIQGA
jgi:CBS domain-containing protein